MTNSGNKRRANASIIIQATLKDAGIEVNLEQVESNTFFERLRKKDYEAALSGWSAGLFVDPSVIWKSGPEYEFNFVSYRNERVDSLIEAGLAEPDPAKSAPIWMEMRLERSDAVHHQPAQALGGETRRMPRSPTSAPNQPVCRTATD